MKEWRWGALGAQLHVFSPLLLVSGTVSSPCQGREGPREVPTISPSEAGLGQGLLEAVHRSLNDSDF